MSLTPTQAIVTATVKGTDLDQEPQKLTQALEPYADACIVTLIQKSNWMTSMRGETSLLAVIDYTPRDSDRVSASTRGSASAEGSRCGRASDVCP